MLEEVQQVEEEYRHQLTMQVQQQEQEANKYLKQIRELD